jgi:hypothetical protein
MDNQRIISTHEKGARHGSGRQESVQRQVGQVLEVLGNQEGDGEVEREVCRPRRPVDGAEVGVARRRGEEVGRQEVDEPRGLALLRLEVGGEEVDRPLDRRALLRLEIGGEEVDRPLDRRTLLRLEVGGEEVDRPFRRRPLDRRPLQPRHRPHRQPFARGRHQPLGGVRSGDGVQRGGRTGRFVVRRHVGRAGAEELRRGPGARGAGLRPARSIAPTAF